MRRRSIAARISLGFRAIVRAGETAAILSPKAFPLMSKTGAPQSQALIGVVWIITSGKGARLMLGNKYDEILYLFLTADMND